MITHNPRGLPAIFIGPSTARSHTPDPRSSLYVLLTPARADSRREKLSGAERTGVMSMWWAMRCSRQTKCFDVVACSGERAALRLHFATADGHDHLDAMNSVKLELQGRTGLMDNENEGDDDGDK
ncbi:hypothetical protein A0H81_13621 [Grifola frondosa]|uniref:Uncharacterized protein n=1 Tax=Grifola frondosa TaxID=5627 RepID=A0A1C7LQ25_GRIFR|nr:hypothetical protein A0H81_13621 [Grifola frondosa]